MVFVHTSVGKDEHVGALSVGLVHFYEQMVQHSLERGALVEQDGNLFYLKTGLVHIFDFQ